MMTSLAVNSSFIVCLLAVTTLLAEPRLGIQASQKGGWWPTATKPLSSDNFGEVSTATGSKDSTRKSQRTYSGGYSKPSPIPLDGEKIAHIAVVIGNLDQRRQVENLVKSLLLYATCPLHLHLVVGPEPSDQAAIKFLFKSWKLNSNNFTFSTYLPPKSAGVYHGSDRLGKETAFSSTQQARLDPLALSVNSSSGAAFTGEWPHGFRALPNCVNGFIAVDTSALFNNDVCHFWKYQVFGVRSSRKHKRGRIGVCGRSPSTSQKSGISLAVVRFPRMESKRQRLNRLLFESSLLNECAFLEEKHLSLPNFIKSTCMVMKGLCYRLPRRDCKDTLMAAGHHSIRAVLRNNAKAGHISNLKHDLTKFGAINDIPACAFRSGISINSLRRTRYAFSPNFTAGVFTDTALSYLHELTLKSGLRSCRHFSQYLHNTPVTHPVFIDTRAPLQKKTTSNKITLVSQLSFNRISLLENICKRWRSPIDLALYATHKQANELVHSKLIEKLCPYQQVRIHMAYKSADYYPINYLRNVALRFTQTRYVFPLDIDFLPSYNLDSKLLQWLGRRVLFQTRSYRRSVFIVAAFEVSDKMKTLPKTKPEMVRSLLDGQAKPFHSYFSPAHLPTNYTQWMEAKCPYEVSWSLHYEPYFAGETAQLPSYDEYLPPRLGNKAAHVMHLDAMEFDFYVLPDVFLLHSSHTKSSQAPRRFTSCVRRLQRDFVNYLSSTYKTSSGKYEGFAYSFTTWRKLRR